MLEKVLHDQADMFICNWAHFCRYQIQIRLVLHVLFPLLVLPDSTMWRELTQNSQHLSILLKMI